MCDARLTITGTIQAVQAVTRGVYFSVGGGSHLLPGMYLTTSMSMFTDSQTLRPRPV
jgi:hypothetical protein